MRLQLALLIVLGEIVADTLVYDDTDAVTVVTPRVELRWPLAGGRGELRGAVLVDSITAASVDVVSHATPGFDELRAGGELGLSLPLGAFTASADYRLSLEPDYRSHGVTLAAERRLGGPDTVLRVGAGGAVDTIGRAGTPFEVWSATAFTGSIELTLTQVVDPSTVVRLVSTSMLQQGYLEKPYRYVPLFDAAGVRLSERPAEEVPEIRFRQALALRVLRWLAPLGGSLRGDYRLYLDSWGVLGHTVELGLRRGLPAGLGLELGSRTVYQGGASFWRRSYVVTPGELPALRSLDRELSPSFAQGGSARLSFARGDFALYLELGVTWVRYLDFLLLDSLTYATVLVGTRVPL